MFGVWSLEMLHVIIRVIVVLACDAMPPDLKEIMSHMTSEPRVFCDINATLCELQINSCHESNIAATKLLSLCKDAGL